MKKALALLALTSMAAPRPASIENVIVFKEDGRFGGWPANNGVWNWGDEILVGFSLGYLKANDRGHAIDSAKRSMTRFARSVDGGRTWRIERPTFPETPDEEDQAAIEPKGGIDFAHPDFAMAVRMISSSRGFSRFYYSYDRGKTWQGPFRLPTYDRKGIAARTDYIVDGKRECTAFITASKEDGREGRVLCVRTIDGGKTWDAIGWIGPEPAGFPLCLLPYGCHRPPF
jgi:hypothetical protein